APGGDREIVAGRAREAGLERLHAAWIVKERDVAGVYTVPIHERRGAQEISRVRVILDQPPGELGEIFRRAPAVRIGEPVGVGEVGGREAELAGLHVHARDEGLLGAAQILGHGGGGVVGGGDTHALEQDAQGYALARAEPHAV